jgi:hypothetical protein
MHLQVRIWAVREECPKRHPLTFKDILLTLLFVLNKLN